MKSSRDGSFFLSSGERSRAQHFADQTDPGRYAVLVVRRSKAGGPPARLDLLVDPVSLVESGQLTRADDTYKISYEAAAPGKAGGNGNLEVGTVVAPGPGSVLIQASP